MKKNVYNTFCTIADHPWLRKDYIIDQQERDCFVTLCEFECDWAFKIKQLDFCHHNLASLIIMNYSNTSVG
jgi:hypothetical protein